MNKKELLLGDYFGGARQHQQPGKRQIPDQRLEQAIEQTYERICEIVQQVPTKVINRRD